MQGDDLAPNVQQAINWWLTGITDGGPQDREARKRLWEGNTADHGGDDSAADLSLVGQLIRRGLTDEEADQAMRASGLYRTKWDDRRGPATYGGLTIAKARQGANDGGTTTGAGTGGGPEPGGGPSAAGGNPAGAGGPAPGGGPSAAGGSANWSHPQSMPIPLSPVPAFDPTWLPDLVRPFCQDVAGSLPCPLDYAATNLFATLGSVWGNKLLVQAKDRNSWLEAANVWGLNVGDVSQMKSPSSRPFTQHLDRLQARAQLRHDAAMAQWRGSKIAHQAYVSQVQVSMNAAAKQAVQAGVAIRPQALPIPPEPPEPQLVHYYTNDATYEKLSELCRGNPYGVLACGDEMSGFLSNLSREDMRPARAFFLTGHNGTSWYKTDRIMRGTVTLSRFAIGVLGNIQPDPLCQYLMEAQTKVSRTMVSPSGSACSSGPIR